jgi:PAS domain S-box-containing protein/putative nucleotidyltransferase with HDIG domain
MTSKNNQPEQAADPSADSTSSPQASSGQALRRQAEGIAREKAFRMPENMESLSVEAARQILHELRVHQIELEMQNEELVQSRTQVEVGLRQYTDLYDFAPVGYFSLARDGAIHQVNLAGANLLGVERGALIKRRFGVFVSARSRTTFSDFLEKVFSTSGSKETCEIALQKDGPAPLWVHIEAMTEDGQRKTCRAVVVDITERKQAEEALRDSEARYRSYIDATDQIGWVTNADGEVVEDVPSLRKFSGQSYEEAKGSGWTKALHPDDLEHSLQAWNKAVAAKSFYEIEYRMRRHDGVYKYLLARGFPVFSEDGSIREWVGTCIDITERKRVEEALRESETLFRKLFEDHAAVELIIDPDTGNIIDANEAAAVFYGWSREQLKQMKIQEINTLSPEEVKKEMEKARTSKKIHFEFRHRRADGSVRDVDVFSSKIEVKGKDLLHSIVHDITDRKLAEEALRESETKLQAIFDTVGTGILIIDKGTQAIIEANQTAIEMTGLPKERIIGQICHSLVCPAQVGKCPVKDLGQSVDHSERKLLCADGHLKDILKTVYPMTIKRRDCYLESFIDITVRKNAEDKLKDTLESLRKAVDTTVQVLVSAVEVRDPYTAGHQLRTADLARAIATEMGLPQEKIDGIRMAGSIHDIGKLSIPAEILSKPTKLTNLEFSIIKEHSQKGYEMLKDVESPWPLAEIVYQHHERMDGSGYPRNLKGDEILMEARIMAVADVVEAMASHRPYRPALGIDAALAEIQKNRGTLYDKAVVDACLKLFRENGFKLEVT